MASELVPGTPDPMALRRRVLGAGVVTLLLFLAVSYVVAALDVSTLWLLPALALVYAAVTRPLLAPVTAAIRLRRRLAYQAFLEQRPDRDGGRR